MDYNHGLLIYRMYKAAATCLPLSLVTGCSKQCHAGLCTLDTQCYAAQAHLSKVQHRNH